MSSATSIDPARPAAGEAGRVRHPGADPHSRSSQNEGFRPWHFFVLLSLLAATAAVVVSPQPTPERLVVLSLAIAGAGLCGAALYAALVPLVSRAESSDRKSVSERTRASLEREKMLTMRSIKELEFDRAMGKISTSDYEELAARLRSRAISLMKQLDADTPGYRERIERDLALRFTQAPPAPDVCSCGTQNDPDALFCKRCGTRLGAERLTVRLQERGTTPEPGEDDK